MASERNHCYRQPLPMVWACRKRLKVANNDVPTRSTTVRHIGGVGGSDMHRGGGVVP